MISRSKSAPRPLNDLAPLAKGRTPKLRRTHTALSLTTTPFATPWEAREDPFSLVGFFPSRPADPQVDWNWIRAREEEVDEDEDGDEVDEDTSAYNDTLAPSTPGQHKQEDSYDEFARQVIDGEDKFGMLAFSSENIPTLLRSKMPMFERPTSPVHVSPLVVDEPLDLDALHSKLCSRRETLIDGEAERRTEIGKLFFSREDDKQDASGWPWTWTKAIYAQLVSLVGGL